jgi:hypothetical protein
VSRESQNRGQPIWRHAWWMIEDRTLLVGGGLWLLALTFCILLRDWTLFTILFPFWTPFVGLIGRVNIGTPEHPFYEFTPIHMLAGLVAILLSAGIYMLPVALWFKWRDRRRSAKT